MTSMRTLIFVALLAFFILAASADRSYEDNNERRSHRDSSSRDSVDVTGRRRRGEKKRNSERRHREHRRHPSTLRATHTRRVNTEYETLADEAGEEAAATIFSAGVVDNQVVAVGVQAATTATNVVAEKKKDVLATRADVIGAANLPAVVPADFVPAAKEVVESGPMPLDRSREWYRSLCLRDSSNILACSPFMRRQTLQDQLAVKEAAALGFSLNVPTTPAVAHGDYDVPELKEGSDEPSPLQKQLATLKELKAAENAKLNEGASKAAAAAAAAAAANAKIAADAAAAKAAADAQIAAAKAQAELDAKAAADKAAAEARAKGESEAAAAAAAAAAKAASEAKAKEDARILAEKLAAEQAAAKAKAEAEAKAAADARAAADAKAAADAEAAKPKIVTGNTPAGLAMVSPNGRTVYFNAAGDFCTGACAPHWPPVRPPMAAGTGVTCTIGQVARPDGGLQVTCNGRPMFNAAVDSGPGQSKGHNDGNGFVIASP